MSLLKLGSGNVICVIRAWFLYLDIHMIAAFVNTLLRNTRKLLRLRRIDKNKKRTWPFATGCLNGEHMWGRSSSNGSLTICQHGPLTQTIPSVMLSSRMRRQEVSTDSKIVSADYVARHVARLTPRQGSKNMVALIANRTSRKLWKRFSTSLRGSVLLIMMQQPKLFNWRNLSKKRCWAEGLRSRKPRTLTLLSELARLPPWTKV